MIKSVIAVLFLAAPAYAINNYGVIGSTPTPTHIVTDAPLAVYTATATAITVTNPLAVYVATQVAITVSNPLAVYVATSVSVSLPGTQAVYIATSVAVSLPGPQAVYLATSALASVSGITNPVTASISSSSVVLPVYLATAPTVGSISQVVTVTPSSGTFSVYVATGVKVDHGGISQPIYISTAIQISGITGVVTTAIGTTTVGVYITTQAKVTHGGIPQPVYISTGPFFAERTRVIISTTNMPNLFHDAVATFTFNRGGSLTQNTSCYLVTAGKTFNIQTIRIGLIPKVPSGTVTFATMTYTFAEGCALNATQVYKDQMLMQTNIATPDTTWSIPGGIEFPGGKYLGFSYSGGGTLLNTVFSDITVVGYEY